MKKLIFCLISICFVISCDAQKKASQATNTYAEHHGFYINHKDEVGEVCPELRKGQKLVFNFKASLPVMFNLHYHKGEEVTYPIEDQELKTIERNYLAPMDQTYCLMWKGTQNKTKIEYHYSIQ